MSAYFERIQANRSMPKAEQTKTPVEDDTKAAYFERIKANRPQKVEQSEDFEQPEENTKHYVRRNIARTAARATETLLGSVGDIAKAPLEEFEKFAVSKITGKPLTEERRESLKKINPMFGGASQILPTSQDIREAHKPITGEYLEPQTENERTADELTHDFTSIALPTGILSKGSFLKNMAKVVGVVGLGQTAKQGAKVLGYEEQGQNIAKTGAMLLASLINPNGAKKLASDLYAKSEQAIGPEVMGNATALEKEMQALNVKMSLGTVSNSEKAIIDETNAILNKIKDGKMSYQEAVAAKRSINEKAESFLYSSAGKLEKAKARKFYNKINYHLKTFIKTAEKEHPEFYQAHSQADEITGTMHQSKKVSNMIMNHLGIATSLGISPAVTQLLGPVENIATLGVGAAALKTGELLFRVVKSPVLRKYYLNAVNAASKENAPLMIKNLKKLDEATKEIPEITDILSQ